MVISKPGKDCHRWVDSGMRGKPNPLTPSSRSSLEQVKQIRTERGDYRKHIEEYRPTDRETVASGLATSADQRKASNLYTLTGDHLIDQSTNVFCVRVLHCSIMGSHEKPVIFRPIKVLDLFLLVFGHFW